MRSCAYSYTQELRSVDHSTYFILCTATNHSISPRLTKKIRRTAPCPTVLEVGHYLPRNPPILRYRGVKLLQREILCSKYLPIKHLILEAMIPSIMPRWLSSLIPGSQNQDRARDDHNIVDIPAGKPLPNAHTDFLRRMYKRANFSESNSKSSKLLDVLPLEIRQIIWEDVLGHHSVHLDLDLGHLVGLFCISANPNTCYRGRGGCRDRLSDKERESEKKMLLPLLLVCKQM
jgi:hypothetical protein